MEVIQAPNQLLRVKTKSVRIITPELKKTTSEMIKLTQTFSDPEGVGLASTQIGKDLQYFVILKNGKNFIAVFNPKILSYSKTTKLFFEGCLSIPRYWGEIKRSTSVEVSYLDINGKLVKEKLTGNNAWFFQHEYDHLQGKLFMDLVLEQKSRLYKAVGRDRAGAEIFEEVKI
ncbi:peptide deformylase [Candidatus Daviesbacteria bacterium]|nr:peptide deformylase [Candidatus Daviesbacteria bacterium]